MENEIAKHLKVRSSRQLMEEFCEIHQAFRGRRIWVKGYPAANNGNVTDEIIAEYGEKQSLKGPDEQDQDFGEDELLSNFIRPFNLPPESW